MAQIPIKLTNYEKKFLFALLEDGSKEDATIARETGISKSSVSRIRKKLQSECVIMDYLPIVDLDRFGIEFYAVVMFAWSDFEEKAAESMVQEVSKNPNVVYFAGGESSDGLTHVMMIGVKDLSEYQEFLTKFRRKYKDHIGRLFSFFVPSKKIVKQDFTDLVKLTLRGVDK